MKFTKEQLAEALKAKMTATGKSLAVSERTILAQAGRIYARLEKANNEDELENIVTEYLADFEEMDANIRNDNSAFIRGWKKEHETEPPQPNPQPEPNKAGTDGDERLKALLERIDKLEAKNAENEAKALREEKVSALKKALKEKGIKDNKWVDNYTRKINITDSTDVEAEVNDAIALFNVTRAGAGGSNITPNGAGGGGDDIVSFSDVAAMRRRIRGITETPKNK